MMQDTSLMCCVASVSCLSWVSLYVFFSYGMQQLMNRRLYMTVTIIVQSDVSIRSSLVVSLLQLALY